MKKLLCLILTISIICFNIIPIENVHAKTLKDYKNELAKLQSEYAENKRVTAQTKASINAKRNAIVTANNTISSNETQVENSKIKVA